MKKQLILLFALFGLVACNSCTQPPAPVPPAPPDPTVVVPPPPDPPPPAPVVDAGPEPIVDRSVRQACEAIAQAGCIEGGPSCTVNVQKALNDRLTPVPLACLVAVHTKADVHACGHFVPCL